MHNLKTSSTGTVHAAVDGLPACPTRARAANPYRTTDEAVTCQHCIKLVAETKRIEAEAAGESTAGMPPRYRNAVAHRLLAAAKLAETSDEEQPAEHQNEVLIVAMSLGLSLGIEAIDTHGYARAEDVVWQMARRELTTYDIHEMTTAFRNVFARRQAAKQCSESDCLMCEAVA